MLQRERKIKSGKLLEVDFYPVFDDGRKVPTRAPKTKRSTPEQEKYNQNQAIKKFVRLVNTNFDGEDVFMTVTYNTGQAPQDEETARRDIVNYLRRLKNKRISELRRLEKRLAENPDDKELRERVKKLREPLRYIYVIEKQVYKTGPRKGQMNFHFHLFVNGGIDRDTLEGMWHKGVRVEARRFMPERYGPEAAAKYLSKDPQGSKRFCYSRNLKQPQTMKPKDGRISHRGVEKLARERVDDKKYWEKRHPGYQFIRCFSRYNEYNGYWYVSVVMYKTDDAAEIPPWSLNDWMDE